MSIRSSDIEAQPRIAPELADVARGNSTEARHCESVTTRGMCGRAAVVLVASGALWGCGASPREAPETAARPLVPQVSSKLQKCLASWNGRAGANVRGVAAGLAPDTNAARVFRFSDGRCGVTVVGASVAVATSVDRGRGYFEPYLSSGGGSGDPPAPVMLTNALSLARDAQTNLNAYFDGRGVIRPVSDGDIETATISSEQFTQGLTGGVQGSRPYVLDEAGWQRLTLAERVAAIAAFAGDKNCSEDAVRAIGSAVRDDSFAVEGDSVEKTLGWYCAGRARDPSVTPTRSRGADPTRDCQGAVRVSGTSTTVLAAKGVSCREAKDVLRAYDALRMPLPGGWECFLAHEPFRRVGARVVGIGCQRGATRFDGLVAAPSDSVGQNPAASTTSAFAGVWKGSARQTSPRGTTAAVSLSTRIFLNGKTGRHSETPGGCRGRLTRLTFGRYRYDEESELADCIAMTTIVLAVAGPTSLVFVETYQTSLGPGHVRGRLELQRRDLEAGVAP